MTTNDDPWPGASEVDATALRAATIAHIERVLVQENVQLRQEVASLRQQVRDLERRVQERESQAAALIRARVALASIAWSTTHEDALRAAEAGLVADPSAEA